MKNIPIRAASVLLLVLGLAACGGSDDATTSDGGSETLVAASVTCETLQFSSAVGVAVPTSGQWASFAGTYTSGATTVVLSASGALTVNSVAIDVKSACYVTTDSMIMVSWGSANTVGAGNIMYDSHIDFRSSGISGVADGVVLSPAS